MRETLYVQDERALADLVRRLDGSTEVALDTEFLRERTYYPKLCLLQLATNELLAIVDPLMVDDLGPLWEVLTGDAEIILHAASQDLEIVQQLAGKIPPRWFDTQVAAAFLGYGDTIAYSKLVERVAGKEGQRSEAYTDWSRRPLAPEQTEYALDDVRYLLECADQLRAGLRERGRTSWVREELELHAEKLRYPADPEEQWRRVSGARGLKGRKLAILRAVAAWRERTAQRRDIPRQRVVADRVLVGIARRAPQNEDQVGKLRGLHPREASRSAAAIVQAVQQGEAVAEEQWPRWAMPPARGDDANTEALASLLDALLRARGFELEMSPRLLGTRQNLVHMVRLAQAGELETRGPGELALMRGWRYESAGSDLHSLLRGEAALRVGEGHRLMREL